MRKLKPAVVLCVLAVTAALYVSCNKDSTEAPNTSFNLEYKIINAKHSISAISFVGPAGDTLVGDISTQSDTLWSKVFTVTHRPYTAGLKAVVANGTGSSINFILQISANGIIQNTVEKSIPPQATTDATVVATIN